MVTRVDIAGYFLVFATLRERRHVIFLFGATSFPRTIEHDPDSFQVFLPVDTLVRRRDKSVDDFFATSLFLMVKPGRAESDKDFAEIRPVTLLVVIVKLYFTPFLRPSTTHEVLVVRHTTPPESLLTT
jgi:hypothetical protein